MKITLLVAAIIATFFFAFTSKASAQNNLTVKVNGLDESKGYLMIALFDSKANFISKKAIGKKTPVTATTVSVVYKNLPEGEYAIALFQDANSNGKLDLGEYGIPTEKYGFSNDADPALTMGPPSFEACMFEIKGDKMIEINAMSAVK